MTNQEREKSTAEDTDKPDKTKDDHDSIVRHELDAAVNSLKKRIENLKGVDVSFPKKSNPFSKGRRDS